MGEVSINESRYVHLTNAEKITIRRQRMCLPHCKNTNCPRSDVATLHCYETGRYK